MTNQVISWKIWIKEIKGIERNNKKMGSAFLRHYMDEEWYNAAAYVFLVCELDTLACSIESVKKGMAISIKNAFFHKHQQKELQSCLLAFLYLPNLFYFSLSFVLILATCFHHLSFIVTVRIISHYLKFKLLLLTIDFLLFTRESQEFSKRYLVIPFIFPSILLPSL